MQKTRHDDREVEHRIVTSRPALTIDGVQYYTTRQAIYITGFKRQYLDAVARQKESPVVRMYRKRWWSRKALYSIVNRSRVERRGGPRPRVCNRVNPEDFYLATLATLIQTEHDYKKTLPSNKKTRRVMSKKETT